ncbi:MAG: hypothetical protein HFG96_06780 [Lachnospiraceae bacterium]|mgnify:CR=1 FL=1|jgi:hypothetical protein|nr:hypothetical protein [Lachnospiraceae bacterium]RKJ50505.1 hypothetical protein D7Y05_04840 [bacterium 1XD42-54]
MKKMQHKMAAAVLIVLSGFFAGTFLPEVFRMGKGTYAGLLSLYSLGKYENAVFLPEKIFPYILKIRLQTLLFLWMSCYTSAGVLFHLGYAWWLAASAGLLLSLFVLREGGAGILLFFCCVFPQWILYAAMWKQELAFLLRLRGRNSVATAVQAAALQRGQLSSLTKLVVFCVAGCVVETFLGNWTLKIFLEIFH